jgi:hypothetical protein
VVQRRKDYAPGGKHKWGFTLRCEHRDVLIVALSELVYRVWVDGLVCLKQYAVDIVGCEGTHGWITQIERSAAEAASAATDC